MYAIAMDVSIKSNGMHSARIKEHLYMSECVCLLDGVMCPIKNAYYSSFSLFLFVVSLAILPE